MDRKRDDWSSQSRYHRLVDQSAISSATLRPLGFVWKGATVHVYGCTGTRTNINLLHLSRYTLLLLLAGNDTVPNDTVPVSLWCGRGIHSAECSSVKFLIGPHIVAKDIKVFVAYYEEFWRLRNQHSREFNMFWLAAATRGAALVKEFRLRFAVRDWARSFVRLD